MKVVITSALMLEVQAENPTEELALKALFPLDSGSCRECGQLKDLGNKIIIAGGSYRNHPVGGE